MHQDVKERYKRASEYCTKAAEYVRQGWCQGTFARDSNGILVPPAAPSACCWCAQGALMKAMDFTGMSDVNRVGAELSMIKCAFTRVTTFGLISYNDSVAQSGEDVAQVFDQIAKTLKQAAE